MLQFKVIVFLTFVYVVSEILASSDVLNKISNVKTQNGRKKRLLFYDEEGNLVKTFTNPYLRDIIQNPATYPFFMNFLRPYQPVLQAPAIYSPLPYMIPVSDEVVQQINHDPVYQNKVLFAPTKETSVEINPICAGKRTQIASPNSCSKFLNCWDGLTFEQECPDGLLFSSQGYCDYSYKVDCGNRRLSDESGSPQCSKDFEAFRNKVTCGEFFVCVNRSPIRFKCPADLYFSEVLGVCDYPSRVDCNIGFSINPSMSPKQPEISSSSEMSADEPVTQEPIIKKLYGNPISSDEDSIPMAMSRNDAMRQLKIVENIKSLNIA